MTIERGRTQLKGTDSVQRWLLCTAHETCSVNDRCCLKGREERSDSLQLALGDKETLSVTSQKSSPLQEGQPGVLFPNTCPLSGCNF